MTVLAATDAQAFPVRSAPALATLIMRQAELMSCGTGLAWSGLASTFWVVTPDAEKPSLNPVLDRELAQTARRWADRLQRIGLSPLMTIALFSSEPAPPDGQELTSFDVLSLHEAIITAADGTGLDPRWLTSVITLARSDLDEPIGVEAVSTSQSASPLAQRRLIDAIERWLKPRRRFFTWISRIYLELDYQADAGEQPSEADVDEAALMWMPAAGSA